MVVLFSGGGYPRVVLTLYSDVVSSARGEVFFSGVCDRILTVGLWDAHRVWKTGLHYL